MNISEEESKQRIDKFMRQYGELVKGLDVDFANYPVYVPDGKGNFKTIIQSTPVDLKALPVPMSFIPEGK